MPTAPPISVLSRAEAVAWAEARREARQQLVFTNGCFDILHVGHVDYLTQARALGDALLVGLNADDSVRRLKGPARPVNPEWARARVLTALRCVDAVVLFDEDTPEALIRSVCPDILVKGSDYEIARIVGADFVIGRGGTVRTIPLVPDVSTTNILTRLNS